MYMFHIFFFRIGTFLKTGIYIYVRKVEKASSYRE